jgi:hypothetical protein
MICGVVICRATLAIGIIVFRRISLVIQSIVVYFAAMSLCGIFVCPGCNMICGVIFGLAAMEIGVVILTSLTPTGICGVVFCRGTLVVGIIVFCCAMPLWE